MCLFDVFIAMGYAYFLLSIQFYFFTFYLDSLEVIYKFCFYH